MENKTILINFEREINFYLFNVKIIEFILNFK